MTAHERTGWRDEAISNRHRDWGYNCPAVDLDFLVVEYNVGEPVALVEYKHERARWPDLRHPTYRALSRLCERAELPFMVVVYRQEPWRFLVQPVNDLAVAVYRGPISLSERRYVASLYYMRGQTIEHALEGRLSDLEDPQASWFRSTLRDAA